MWFSQWPGPGSRRRGCWGSQEVLGSSWKGCGKGQPGPHSMGGHRQRFLQCQALPPILVGPWVCVPTWGLACMACSRETVGCLFHLFPLICLPLLDLFTPLLRVCFLVDLTSHPPFSSAMPDLEWGWDRVST